MVPNRPRGHQSHSLILPRTRPRPRSDASPPHQHLQAPIPKSAPPPPPSARFKPKAMTAALAWLVLGEPLGAAGAAGSVLSLVGLLVLMHPPFLAGGHADWGPRRVAGVAFGIVSAVFT